MIAYGVLLCLAFSIDLASSQNLPRLSEPVFVAPSVEDTCSAVSEHDEILQQIVDTTTGSLGAVWPLVLQLSSCAEVVAQADVFTPGFYWLKGNNGSAVQVYCAEGGKSRIGMLNMTDPMAVCPSPWKEVIVPGSVRSCVRGITTEGCESVFFATNGAEYNQVCGKVIGYQNGLTNAFQTYYEDSTLTIDDAYFAGMVLTVGAPGSRQHIWSWVASLTEAYNGCACNCKCTNYGSPSPADSPSWVGNDYFCETAQTAAWNGQFYSNDPLWDGDGCGAGSNCCSFPGSLADSTFENIPPNFCKQLGFTTTDDLELRLCRGSGGSSFNGPAIEQIELSVQLV